MPTQEAMTGSRGRSYVVTERLHKKKACVICGAQFSPYADSQLCCPSKVNPKCGATLQKQRAAEKNAAGPRQTDAKLTKAQELEVVALYERTLSSAKIAPRFGITKERVREIVAAHGVKLRTMYAP